MQSCLVMFVLICALSSANARNVYCHPGQPSVEWDGLNWVMSGYFGPLSEVTVSTSIADNETTVITCKRGSVEAYAFVKKKCRFAPGTKVIHRMKLKGEALVCHLDKALNETECIVECDD